MDGSTAPAGDSALARLRAATCDLHDRVEATAPAARILAADVTAACYLDFLIRTRAALLPVEAALAQAAPGLPEDLAASVRAALRGPALDADIAALGGAPATARPAPPPLAPAVLVGMLYVLEGSALGGAVIARHVRARLGADALRFTAYHSGAGDRAAERWARVRGLIARLDPAETDQACAAAALLFERFLDAYSGD